MDWLFGIGYSSPVLQNNLFTEDFQVIEYVDLSRNNIQTIEPNAFGYLTKLKWIRLYNNIIQSSHFLILKKNPDLIYIDFDNNKIASINPNFFYGLNKLKFVEFRRNLCIEKYLGCNTCSVGN